MPRPPLPAPRAPLSRVVLPTLLLALVGCGKGAIVVDDSGGGGGGDSLLLDDTGIQDADGDGWIAAEDCDDSDAAISPDADELCDGVDNDCDDEVDEDPVDGQTWYTDADGDGYGDEEISACEQPSDAVDEAGDCDDSAAEVNPGAEEVCDDADTDEDCDGLIDDDDDEVSGLVRWYADDDEDGYGDPDSSVRACDVPDGYVADSSDCDDTDTDQPALGCLSDYDGRYSGTFEVEAEIAAWYTTDTCSGEAELVIDHEDDPMISGTASCSFSGSLYYLGEREAEITGDVSLDGEASGVIRITDIEDESWSGKAGGGELSGSFSGTTTYYGYEVEFDGIFETSR